MFQFKKLSQSPKNKNKNRLKSTTTNKTLLQVASCIRVCNHKAINYHAMPCLQELKTSETKMLIAAWRNKDKWNFQQEHEKNGACTLIETNTLKCTMLKCLIA